MTIAHRVLLGVLMLVGVIVLLGQLWPDGAPPFARFVNIAFLVVTLGYFGWTQLRARRPAAT